ncbi:polycystic kidney disease protein 1-like 2 [Dreissena polymorpha]|uniref:polycystic kidney disease protein 1-like 2 n=1 Tax=Dreissena polymorpha TaxID=45954 RepID=UPI002264D8A0|nr:polycystic kidney disease protein 1-like 2 [Dreissena polymorpha]
MVSIRYKHYKKIVWFKIHFDTDGKTEMDFDKGMEEQKMDVYISLLMFCYKQWIKVVIKVELIFLSETVGVSSLEFPQDSVFDLSAMIETTAGEVYYMMQAVANSAVPDNMKQLRCVDNLDAGRAQISDMLAVIGQDINLTASTMFDNERAYLYQMMQRKLLYELANKKNTTKAAAKMVERLAQQMQDELRVCMTCDNSNNTKTEQLIRKNTAEVLANSRTTTKTSEFKLDGLAKAVRPDGQGGEEDVSLSAIEFTENVYMYDNDGTSSFVTSNILRIDTKTKSRRITPERMTFSQNAKTPIPTTITPNDTVKAEDASEFSYHRFVYGKSTDNVCLKVVPLGNNITSYRVYFRFHQAPSILDFEFDFLLEKDDDWQHCINASSMLGHTGLTYFAVQVPGFVKEIQYNLTLITGGCLTWNEAATKWETDKCEMTWRPRENKIDCLCTNITDLVFANSFFVAPNSIDFATVFLKFSPLNQAAVTGTFACLLLLYIISVVVLARMDRRDRLKWGITALRDNRLTDSSYYLIRVLTGMREGAGTRSRIAFVLTGQNGDTGSRELFDGVREEFSTGSVMTFLMATRKHLGTLEHMCIWHDNSGEGDNASWYLNQVSVYDAHTKQAYTFVAEKWLSVETEVFVNMNAKSENEPIEFESRFFYQTRDRLSESHMWVSIFYRPQISPFTRVQRLSCALVYICLTMIANAMFYKTESDYESPPLLQAGPFRFTAQQIFVSITCALITTPPVMLLMVIFKRTKRRQDMLCKCCTCPGVCCRFPCSSTKRDASPDFAKQLRSIMLTSEVPEFTGVRLPWWFIIFGWLLVVAGTLVPAFFVLLYSMQWGKQKSEEWLTSFLLSIFESMLFVDTIMVMCFAFVFACLFRKSKGELHVDMDTVVQNYKKLTGEDKDDMSSIFAILKKIKDEYVSYTSTPRNVSMPMQPEEMKEAAKQRRLELNLIKCILDFILNTLLMFIVCVIAFANRDDMSYYHRQELIRHFVSPAHLPAFKSIKTQMDMFNWIKNTMIPNLFPETDINGDALHWYYRTFMTGLNNYRLGPPRLRQLRTRAGYCNIPYFGNTTCYGEYNLLDEETEGYCIGWQSQPCSVVQQACNVAVDAWSFTSGLSIELLTHQYS